MSSKKSKTDSDTPIIEPGLDTLPRENLEAWLAATGDVARKYCTTHNTFGALHLACTDALWNALHPAPAGGGSTPRPTHPRPADLAGTEALGLRLVRASKETLYQDHSDAEAVLRLSLLKSIGQTNRKFISAPITGLHALATNDIIVAMVNRHGVRTETDL